MSRKHRVFENNGVRIAVVCDYAYKGACYFTVKVYGTCYTLHTPIKCKLFWCEMCCNDVLSIVKRLFIWISLCCTVVRCMLGASAISNP